MRLLLPLRLDSAANLRERWQVRARRVASQRQFVAVYIRHQPVPALPVVVTLVRIAPRALDGDNLQTAFKAVRDEVAKWLGVPDNNPGIEWRYDQRRGPPRTYQIEIEVLRG